MTDQTVLIIVAAIVPTLGAFGAMVVAIINSFKASTLLKKADEIHTLTNSNLSKVNTALEVATAKIEQMEKRIAGMDTAKRIADRLAESHAERPGSSEPIKAEIVNKPDEPANVKLQA